MGQAFSTKLIQALAKQADREARAKEHICQTLDCTVWRLPARMQIPFAFSKGETVIGFADIIYMEGVVSGVEYSIEKLMKARQLSTATKTPVYIVVATDDGIVGVNTDKEPDKTNISLTFRTEDTEEVVPFVFYGLEQFSILSVDQPAIAA